MTGAGIYFIGIVPAVGRAQAEAYREACMAVTAKTDGGAGTNTSGP